MQAHTKYNKRHIEVIEVMTWKIFLLKSQDCACSGTGQSISWHSTQVYHSQQYPLGIEKIRFLPYKRWKRYVWVWELPYPNFLQQIMIRYPWQQVRKSFLTVGLHWRIFSKHFSCSCLRIFSVFPNIRKEMCPKLGHIFIPYTAAKPFRHSSCHSRQGCHDSIELNAGAAR